jgi:Homeodomain-like domain
MAEGTGPRTVFEPVLTVHQWVAKYLSGQLAGLADRSHRPHSSPKQVDGTVEAAVAEMRREHPQWGSRRIRLEMLHKPGPRAGETVGVPSERTIDRILHRHGLLRSRPRKRPKDSYQRFERPDRCSCGRWTSSAASGWSAPLPGYCVRLSGQPPSPGDSADVSFRRDRAPQARRASSPRPGCPPRCHLAGLSAVGDRG